MNIRKKYNLIKFALKTNKIAKQIGFDRIYHLLTAGYLHDIGWFKSITQDMCVDMEYNKLPWMTYPFISFITPRLDKEISVFEYGSGYSTIWWAKNC